MISLPYLAGFVDGEGYLALARIRRSGRNPEYCVRLVIYNTCREILEHVQQSWGGTLSAAGQRHPAWKPAYALIWTNAAASALLRDLAPYLQIKARQASLLLGYQDHIRASSRLRDCGGHLLRTPAEERRRREKLFRRLKRMNTREPSERSRHDAPPPPERGVRRISSSYLAGFIDGEGSFMITKSTSASHGRVQYRARIAIANTERDVLERIRQDYGGILVGQVARNPSWNPCFLLVWSDGMAEGLLARVTPHLRIKQLQAQLLAEVVRHKATTVQGHQGRDFARHPEEVVAYREACHLRMARLNARGPPPFHRVSQARFGRQRAPGQAVGDPSVPRLRRP